jgi:LPS sulfotransferase NodH
MPDTSYLVCTQHRSGSTMLCSGLWLTRECGEPGEVFGPEGYGRFSKQFGVTSPVVGGSMGTYVEALRKATATPNGVFGAKLMATHAPRLLSLGAAVPGVDASSPGAVLRAIFPGLQLVRLRRRDKVAAAVSNWLASTTDVWAIWPDQPRPPDEPDLPTDIDAISRAHRMHHVWDTMWDAFIPTLGLPTYELTYEDMLADWEGRLTAVVSFIHGRAWSGPVPAPKTIRQGSQRRREHIQAWNEATGGCAACAC